MQADFSLEPGETVRWQACPASRAYVFRRWRWSLACLPVWLVLTVCLANVACCEVRSALGGLGWYAIAWGLLGYGAIGHLLVARWRWWRISYLVTDRRIWLRCGLRGHRVRQLALEDVELYGVMPVSGSVATVQLRSRTDGSILTLYCLEDAAILVALIRGGAQGGNPLTPRQALD
ncbi:hypothetical protein Pcar_1213 [Syntrophotalea carbinolica DSM 2380]|uniref:DUF304 domain-containing protein n=1 Tax=Syntrophotalea carbinolica (strain DSM 2380 / NBRC 103641 / GraBd1) TaxID=338963 RepID=Q3A595_SYNC1|nr:hypothetical protein [Syntrophotalea carbinolica]ABA88462.2 hypothetical protein Pcar_1213 [Syntrophotalea carbinolica DSM 2380]